VRSKALAVFTRQLSVMIDAGLPLVQCLSLLSDGHSDPQLIRAARAVRMEVEGGASLAAALRRQPQVFDPLYCNMVAAGEAGGILDVILKRLAVFIEKQATLTAHVRAAAVYPVSILTVAFVVVVLILWKVVPMFTSLFEGFDATLPLPTMAVIWMSQRVAVFIPFFVTAGALGSWMFRRWYATPKGRARVDQTLLAIPMVGGVLRRVAIARFCRTLGTLLGAGVPLIEGLEITARTSGNAIVENAVRSVRERVEGGETIWKPLSATGVFPPMVAQMIGVGEHTGALDTMLGKIAEFYEEEVDTAVRGLVSILEPALVSVLGVVVGGIVVSMYLPLFDLIGQLS
jgi:type IV pilus assembly protein PilC